MADGNSSYAGTNTQGLSSWPIYSGNEIAGTQDYYDGQPIGSPYSTQETMSRGAWQRWLAQEEAKKQAKAQRYTQAAQFVHDLLSRYAGPRDWITNWFLKYTNPLKIAENVSSGGDITVGLQNAVQDWQFKQNPLYRGIFEPSSEPTSDRIRRAKRAIDKLKYAGKAYGPAYEAAKQRLSSLQNPLQAPAIVSQLAGPNWWNFQTAAKPMSAQDWASRSETEKAQLAGYADYQSRIGGGGSWEDYLGNLERLWSTKGAPPQASWRALKQR